MSILDHFETYDDYEDYKNPVIEDYYLQGENEKVYKLGFEEPNYNSKSVTLIVKLIKGVLNEKYSKNL